MTETYFCTLDPDDSLYLYTITIIIALGAVYLFIYVPFHANADTEKKITFTDKANIYRR